MLKFINVVFFQWFFVRVIKYHERVITEFNLYECSIVGPGQFAIGGTGKHKEVTWFELVGWVRPLTKWKGKGNKFSIRLTKKVSHAM